MKKHLVKILYTITGLTTVIGAFLKITHKAGYLIFLIGIVSFAIVTVFIEAGKSKKRDRVADK